MPSNLEIIKNKWNEIEAGLKTNAVDQGSTNNQNTTLNTQELAETVKALEIFIQTLLKLITDHYQQERKSWWWQIFQSKAKKESATQLVTHLNNILGQIETVDAENSEPRSISEIKAILQSHLDITSVSLLRGRSRLKDILTVSTKKTEKIEKIEQAQREFQRKQNELLQEKAKLQEQNEINIFKSNLMNIDLEFKQMIDKKTQEALTALNSSKESKNSTIKGKEKESDLLPSNDLEVIQQKANQFLENIEEKKSSIENVFKQKEQQLEQYQIKVTNGNVLDDEIKSNVNVIVLQIKDSGDTLTATACYMIDDKIQKQELDLDNALQSSYFDRKKLLKILPENEKKNKETSENIPQTYHVTLTDESFKKDILVACTGHPAQIFLQNIDNSLNIIESSATNAKKHIQETLESYTKNLENIHQVQQQNKSLEEIHLTGLGVSLRLSEETLKTQLNKLIENYGSKLEQEKLPENIPQLKQEFDSSVEKAHQSFATEIKSLSQNANNTLKELSSAKDPTAEPESAAKAQQQTSENKLLPSIKEILDPSINRGKQMVGFCKKEWDTKKQEKQKSEIANFKAKLKQSRSDFKKTLKQFVESEITRIKEGLSISKSIETLKQEFADSVQEKKAALNIDTLARDTSSFLHQLKSSESAKKETEETIYENTAATETITSDTEASEVKITSRPKRPASIQREIDDHNKKIEDLIESQKQSFKEKIENIKLRKENKNLNLEKSQLTKQAAALSESYGELNSAHEVLKDQQKKLKETSENQQKELEELRGEKKLLSETVDKQKQEISKLEDIKSKLLNFCAHMIAFLQFSEKGNKEISEDQNKRNDARTSMLSYLLNCQPCEDTKIILTKSDSTSIDNAKQKLLLYTITDTTSIWLLPSSCKIASIKDDYTIYLKQDNDNICAYYKANNKMFSTKLDLSSKQKEALQIAFSKMDNGTMCEIGLDSRGLRETIVKQIKDNTQPINSLDKIQSVPATTQVQQQGSPTSGASTNTGASSGKGNFVDNAKGFLSRGLSLWGSTAPSSPTSNISTTPLNPGNTATSSNLAPQNPQG